MARQLKPLKVDEVYSPKFRVRVEIMLDRNTKTFYAEYKGQKVTGGVCFDVKNETAKLIERLSTLHWRKVISLTSMQETFRTDFTYVGVKAKRFEIAENPNRPGHWLRRDFEPEEDREFVEDLGWNEAEAFDWLAPEERHARIRSGVGHSGMSPNHREEIIQSRITAPRQHVILEYDDATWAAIQLLIERVQRASEQLNDLLQRQNLGLVLKKLTQPPPILVLPEGKRSNGPEE